MSSDFSPTVNYLWAATLMLELVVAALLVVRGYLRRLPFFSAYIALNLCQAVLIFALYHYYGERSTQAYIAGWSSEAITLGARLCATVELLRLVLMAYRGIWGMAWRLLAFTCPLVLALVGIFFSRSEAQAFVMELDSGFHIVFAVALILCLGLLHYYPIRVEPVYKVLLLGFCWYSCAKILANAAMHGFSYAQSLHYWPMWQILSMSPYLLVLILWASALSQPAPAVQQQPTLLTDEQYRDIAPEITAQLEAINRRLMNFWKIRGPKQ